MSLAAPSVPLNPAALPHGLAALFARFETYWQDAAPITRFTVEDTAFDCRATAPSYAELIRGGIYPTTVPPTRQARLLLLDAPRPDMGRALLSRA